MSNVFEAFICFGIKFQSFCYQLIVKTCYMYLFWEDDCHFLICKLGFLENETFHILFFPITIISITYLHPKLETLNVNESFILKRKRLEK